MVPFRLLSLGTNVLIGVGSSIASQAADTASNGGLFGIAAIIAALCTGVATIIGAAVGGMVKLRQAKPRRRRVSRAELLRRRAELDEQLADLEEKP